MAGLNPDEQELLNEFLASRDRDSQLERDMADFGLYRNTSGRWYAPAARSPQFRTMRDPVAPSGRSARPLRPPPQQPTGLVRWFMDLPHDTDRPHELRTQGWAEPLAEAWLGVGFTPRRVSEWIIGAGLAPDEFALAQEMADAGISPDIACVVISGDSVLQRIRERRLSMPQLTRLLRRNGYDLRAPA